MNHFHNQPFEYLTADLHLLTLNQQLDIQKVEKVYKKQVPVQYVIS